ncbi:hypothetical protein ACFWZ4_06885 [Frateuria sp. GZRe12]|uniref:hypothetical protein n=1 Tax=Frateuria sp. GZRe12 TaxID=3351533 RepID=UPI003EDC0E5C
MEKHTRNYLLAVRLPLAVLLAAIALYAVSVRHLGPAGRAIALAALMACYVWAGWTEFQQIRRMDEMRRRLEMEAMVLAFIANSGVILLLYFVRASKLVDVPFVVAPLALWSCYLLAHLWARLRYRYWSL